MSEFEDKFKTVTDFVHGAAKSIFGRLDQFSFKMLVDQLKSDDYEAVNVTIDQLIKEKKPLSIPPLYFVHKEHPNPRIRSKAEKALAAIGDIKTIKKLTDGKSTEEAIKALIEEYGHYRH